MSRALLLIAVLVAAHLVGCAAQVDPSRIQTSQEDFDNGMQAFAVDDFDGARDAFTKVINAGGLTPDAIAEAYLLRAEACIRLNDLETARNDLQAVEQAAPDLARWYALVGQLELAAGNLDAGKAAYGEARKIDPKLPLPEQLR